MAKECKTRDAFARSMKEKYENSLTATRMDDTMKDLLECALARVDWRQIAAHYLTEKSQ